MLQNQYFQKSEIGDFAISGFTAFANWIRDEKGHKGFCDQEIGKGKRAENLNFWPLENSFKEGRKCRFFPLKMNRLLKRRLFLVT